MTAFGIGYCCVREMNQNANPTRGQRAHETRKMITVTLYSKIRRTYRRDGVPFSAIVAHDSLAKHGKKVVIGAQEQRVDIAPKSVVRQSGAKPEVRHGRSRISASYQQLLFICEKQKYRSRNHGMIRLTVQHSTCQSDGPQIPSVPACLVSSRHCDGRT